MVVVVAVAMMFVGVVAVTIVGVAAAFGVDCINVEFVVDNLIYSAVDHLDARALGYELTSYWLCYY